MWRLSMQAPVSQIMLLATIINSITRHLSNTHIFTVRSYIARAADSIILHLPRTMAVAVCRSRILIRF